MNSEQEELKQLLESRFPIIIVALRDWADGRTVPAD